MLNQAYDLTFGVELELVFVFHEKLIVGQLKRDYPREGGGGETLDNGQLLDGDNLATWRDLLLQKHLPVEAREALPQGATHYALNNDRYNSWAVQVRDRWPGGVNEYNVFGPREEGVRVCNIHGDLIHPLNISQIHGVMPRDERPLRTYYTEPLEIAREVLRTEGIFPYWSGNKTWIIHTYDGVRENKPLWEYEFKDWHLTNDFSLSALPPHEFGPWLRQHKRCAKRDGPRPSTNSLEPTYLAPSETVKVSKWVDATGDSVRDPAATTSTTPRLQRATSESHSIGLSSSVERAVNELLDSERPGPPLQEGSKASRKRKRVAEEDYEEESREGPRPSHSPPMRRGQGFDPDVNEWDSYGIELVSSVLRESEEAWATIKKACNTLKGRPCHHHCATTNDTCGLHVHLKPGDEDFDLLTLQHLCYILVLCEEKIDRLHPQHRRATNPIANSMSEFDFATNVRYFRNGNLSITRNAIMSTSTPLELKYIMGVRKGHVVNFANLGREEGQGPRTLEFRQHEGVLRGEMVKHWVLFCIALVRLANNMAHDRTQSKGDQFEDQFRQYPFESTDFNTMSVWDLFDLMQLPRNTWEYFPYGWGESWGTSYPPTPSEDRHRDDGVDDTHGVRAETTPDRSGRPFRFDSNAMPTIEEENGPKVSARPLDADILDRREYTQETDDEGESADGKVERPRIMDRVRMTAEGLQADTAASGDQTGAPQAQDSHDEQGALPQKTHPVENPYTPPDQRDWTESLEPENWDGEGEDDEGEYDEHEDDEEDPGQSQTRP
ncbi:hypothetical protein MMC30_003459 [Trapelia coarctata]|nr:hypothetical protein [Trapelia coarctata]